MHYPDYIWKGEPKDSILENMEAEFLHWVEIDILPTNWLTSETLQDSILNKIISRIKTNT